MKTGFPPVKIRKAKRHLWRGLKVRLVTEKGSANEFPDDSPKQPSEKSLQVELKGLIQLARTAYDQKRRKECLALTKALLKIDPASHEARVLQSMIQSDIQQALQRINALVKNPRMKNDEELRTNAYQMLQSVLEIDPDNKAANALLPEVEPIARQAPPAGPAETKVRPEQEKRTERPGWTPPEVGPPESFPPSGARPKNYWIRYAALIAVALVIAAFAFRLGLVSNVLEWFGARKTPPTGALSLLVNRLAWLVPISRRGPESFF
jgi:tetratricopeptide (TPR) repeat protein